METRAFSPGPGIFLSFLAKGPLREPQMSSSVGGLATDFILRVPLDPELFLLVADELDDWVRAEELAAESSGGGMSMFVAFGVSPPVCVPLAEPDAVTLVLSTLAVGGPWFASAIEPLGEEGDWFWTRLGVGSPSVKMDMISKLEKDRQWFLGGNKERAEGRRQGSVWWNLCQQTKSNNPGKPASAGS